MEQVGPKGPSIASSLRSNERPSQTWKAFLDNHVTKLVSVDFFTVPTATFRVLLVFRVLAYHRRPVVHFNVREHPMATGQEMYPDKRDAARAAKDKIGHPSRFAGI